MTKLLSLHPRILLWATRYALGRATGAVDDVCAAIADHADALPADVRRSVADDIAHAAARDGLGPRDCADRWRRALAALDPRRRPRHDERP